MKYLFLLLAIFIGFESGCCVSADEISERDRLMNRIAYLLWNKEDFEQLNKLADVYRTKKERTSSGLWKLSFFYRAINLLADTDKKDESFWEKIKGKTTAWCKKYPNSPTAHIAHGIVLKNYAWKTRGSGWAKDVSPENWEPFHKQLKIAGKYLMTHKEIASRDPNWYVEMARIANAEGWDEADYRKLLDEGIQNENYYYPLYFTAIDYYSPKWHGSAEDIEKFANHAVEKTSKEEGMGLYARIYWYIYNSQYQDKLFRRSLVRWPKMKKGIDDVLARYPDSWNINHFAKFSCLAGDAQKTRELMNMIKTPMNRVWGSEDFFNKCKMMQ